jgi:hypothetical protein
MLCYVVLSKFTGVSEVPTASTIRDVITLMMVAVSTSETAQPSTRLHNTTSQKAVTFNVMNHWVP